MLPHPQLPQPQPEQQRAHCWRQQQQTKANVPTPNTTQRTGTITVIIKGFSAGGGAGPGGAGTGGGVMEAEAIPAKRKEMERMKHHIIAFCNAGIFIFYLILRSLLFSLGGVRNVQKRGRVPDLRIPSSQFGPGENIPCARLLLRCLSPLFNNNLCFTQYSSPLSFVVFSAVPTTRPTRISLALLLFPYLY